MSPAESATSESARERKRRETRQRIADAGLRLFLTHGYEGTTLDAIAAEAGISRRTFFSYFNSKDDLLFAWQEAGWQEMNAELLEASPDERPLDAVRDIMLRYIARYSEEDMESLDRVLRSIGSITSRKQAFYAEQERALFATLCQVWRQPERRMGLRMVAMASIGAMRVATQARGERLEERTSIARLLTDAFDALGSEV